MNEYTDSERIRDIIAVLQIWGGEPPALDEIAFGVATEPDSRGAWFPFDEPGDVYLVDLAGSPLSEASGREFAGLGRRPWKWDTKVEVFATLDEAKARSGQVKERYPRR